MTLEQIGAVCVAVGVAWTVASVVVVSLYAHAMRRHNTRRTR